MGTSSGRVIVFVCSPECEGAIDVTGRASAPTVGLCLPLRSSSNRPGAGAGATELLSNVTDAGPIAVGCAWKYALIFPDRINPLISGSSQYLMLRDGSAPRR